MMRYVLLFAVFLSFPAFAVEPAEMLPDPLQESRAREVSRHLRCLVCQGQDIDSSNADLARDLRVLVRQRIAAGDSDEQVLAYVHDRYGDYVLMRPPFRASTFLLWGLPFFILGLGMVVVLRQRRKG